MASPTSASEPASAKRTLLLETAERLFYRDGYRIVGIDLILAEAGVAKMTLYNHFASKEALIVAVLERRDRKLLTAIADEIEAAGRSPLRRLLAIFDWHETWFASADYNGCAFIRALSEYPDPTHEIHRAAWRHKLAVRAVLADLCAAAGAAQPAALAITFSLLLDGAIIAAHATRSTEPAVIARAAAQILLKHAAS